MDNQKNQIAERLNQATNILVTVSTNPSVDQLAGAIGLTLLLNKLGKHATAVFSGAIPSTIGFLQPEKTLEKSPNSLRDFIIALDKTKADKLRYKVEDEMVKIFITPYMTSITDKDLEFSQGDFNVDVVVAIGVQKQEDLDQAITAHGRILHDATVIGISHEGGVSLGSINWADQAASSLCEMLTQLGVAMKADVLDNQMATALLTGIVAETNRFSNEKTSAETMQVSAQLMAAGANQQLVASQLQPPVTAAPSQPGGDVLELPHPDQAEQGKEPAASPPPAPSPSEESPDGTLRIDHEQLKDLGLHSDVSPELPALAEDEPEPAAPEQIHIDEEGGLHPSDQPIAGAASDAPQLPETPAPNPEAGNSGFILEPPTLGGTLTANSQPESLDPANDILGPVNNQGPLLSHGNDAAMPTDSSSSTGLASVDEPEDETEGDGEEGAEASLPELPLADANPEPPSAADDTAASDASDKSDVPPLPPLPVIDQPEPQTLADLEKSLSSAPIEPTAPAANETQESPSADVDAARDAVSQAMSAAKPQILEPVQSLNAQPMDLNLGDIPAVNTSPASAFADNPIPLPPIPATDNAIASDPGLPPTVVLPTQEQEDSAQLSGHASSPVAPPPVPPPMMPPMTPPLGSDDPTVM
ncbi:MAG TPA: hypothetical protein VM124_02580 [Candidatus Limnocylindrales bacterium]|nr:hypothetical protein [Candidatus Limnocylindrales bacterium]